MKLAFVFLAKGVFRIKNAPVTVPHWCHCHASSCCEAAGYLPSTFTINTVKRGKEGPRIIMKMVFISQAP